MITVYGQASTLSPADIRGITWHVPPTWEIWRSTLDAPLVEITDEPIVVLDGVTIDGSRQDVDLTTLDTDAPNYGIQIKPPATGGELCYIDMRSLGSNLAPLNIEPVSPGDPGFEKIIVRVSGEDTMQLVRIRGAYGSLEVISDTSDPLGRSGRNTTSVKGVSITGETNNANDWGRGPAKVRVTSEYGLSTNFFQCVPFLDAEIRTKKFGIYVENGVEYPFLNETTAAGNTPPIGEYRNTNGSPITKVDDRNGANWLSRITSGDHRRTIKLAAEGTSPWASNDQPSTFLRTCRAAVAEDIGSQGITFQGIPGTTLDSDIETNRSDAGGAAKENIVLGVDFTSGRHIRGCEDGEVRDCSFNNNGATLRGVSITAPGSTVSNCRFGQNRNIEDFGGNGYVDDNNQFGQDIP